MLSMRKGRFTLLGLALLVVIAAVFFVPWIPDRGTTASEHASSARASEERSDEAGLEPEHAAEEHCLSEGIADHVLQELQPAGDAAVHPADMIG